MIQNILNLVGKNSLIGNLIVSARQLNLEFNVTNSDDGKQYIASLTEIFEFGMSLRPEVGFCYLNEKEARNYTFDNQGKFISILMEISQTMQPLCLFNHTDEHQWTYVFVLMNSADIIPLFQQAKPKRLFFYPTLKGQLMLAHWHDFSYITQSS